MPLAVVVVGCIATAAAVYSSHHALQVHAEAQFTREADTLEAEIRRRLGRAADGLESLRAAYAIGDRLETSELRSYMQRRNMADDFPGLRGFGISEPVPRAEREAFEARQRTAGHPEFRVRTSGAEEPMYVIRSIEPLASNPRALGFDSGSNPLARSAIDQAVSTGITTMSAPLVLQQDQGRGMGYVLYMPVYLGEPRSATQRMASVDAVLFASFIARELLGDAVERTGVRIGFRVRDESRLGPVVFEDRSDVASSARTTFRAVLVGDRLLTIDMADLLGTAERTAGGLAPWIIGAVGGVLTLLLAIGSWLLVAGRLQALARVASMGKDVQRLANIVERTSAAVFTADARGRLRWTNAGMERLTGGSRDRLVGRSAVQALAAADSLDGAALVGFEKAVAEGSSCRVELSGRSASGEPAWFELTLDAEYAGDGSIRGFNGIALDVTRRKKAEDQLTAREHLLRTITDNIPAGISYWDCDGRCRFANQRMRAFWGRGDPQLLGKSIGQVLPAELRRALRPRFDQVVAGRAQRFEYAAPGEDGEDLTWQVHVLPDSDGAQVQGYFVLASDVTELRQARDLALEASRAKTQFLSSMSHEIRTPMNAVLGMLTLLRGTAQSDRQRDYTDKAEGAARSLLSLLNDVLDIAKIEAGKMELDCRPFSLDGLLADLSTILSVNVGDKDLEVLYDPDPKVPDLLVGDDMRLRQILINLGGNAVKFTERGEVVVRTRLLARDDGHVSIEFAVTDSGIGIRNEDQQKLFRDFVQVNGGTTRRFGGSGLGLGICRRLTELMGSTLHLQSVPGRGSTFSFTLRLPVAPPAVQRTPAEATPLRVLVTDDNAVARSTLTAMVRGIGWSADAAADGHEALRRIADADAEGRPYRAVFVDWHMPGMDGWQLTRRVHELPLACAAPRIVIVTAHGRETPAVKPAREAALVDAFLVKPITPGMLRNLLEVDRAGVPGTAPAAPAPQATLQGLRLLVAEDNIVNQQIARELLTAQGAVVEIAEDGRQAVARLATGEPYDCVLMDMLMPEMDGLQATRTIRHELGLRVPIIAMTANVMESDRAECMAAGMDDHIGKPFAVEQVAAAIRRLLQQQPLEALAPCLAAGAATLVPPVLDRPGAIARMGGDAALFERMRAPFLGNLSALRRRLAAAAEQVRQAGGASDPTELARLLHTIKGAAATMGAMRLAAAAELAEQAVRRGDPLGNTAASPLPEVTHQMDEVARELQAC